jgi:hypothetical protein
MKLGVFRHRSKWPAPQPEWADKVERWYQLDPAAFVMADAYWTFRAQLKEPPHWLLLASPGASNFTDAQFATATSPSPAKFVHTLPNIRGCSLLQLMKWTGLVLCLQKDPGTILFALSEAFRLAETEEKAIWIASSHQVGEDWAAEIYTVGQEGYLEVRSNPEALPSTRDDEWFQWLDGSQRKIVADGYEIIKK